jgi:glycosyltransferase involved in cell wall biosynthesis
MLAELTSAHCLVFPIRNKPLNLARCPFKCYQFAQSGRPVITSDVGEVRSILGDHALYVEPTAEAIADALHRIMSSPRRPDVPYDLSEQIWEQRAATLSERLLMMRS